MDSNVLLDNLTSSDSLDSSPNQNAVYIAQNSLSRQNSNNNLTLYEIRKSKRGGYAPSQNNYNMSTTNTIKTATYVSPNGTLSKINIISNDNSQGNTATLIKQQQLNGLSNTRNLSNLIGLQHAQPNDYCASGRIGALLANNSNTNSLARNHYLIPCNSTLNDNLDSNLAQGNQYGSVHLSQQLQQHHQPGSNINFNYSSSDTDNDSPNLVNNASVLHDRKVYTTSSFGRQQQQQNVSNVQSIQPPQLPANYQVNTFDDRRNGMFL
jgi:hypothetical protein